MRIVQLALTCLRPDPAQPRRSLPPTELTALADSIRDRGLLLPLRVTPADPAGLHTVVCGHRRYAALVHLGVTAADCVVADSPPDEAAVLAEGLTENLLRESLDPLDEADGYRRYLTLTGGTAARAAADLHVPPARVSRALALLDLPADARAAIRAGRLPKETAYHLSRLPAGDERDRLFARAAAGGLTRDAAAAAVRTTRRPTAAAALARVVCPLGGGRSLTVSGSAVTLDALIGSLEEVLKAARRSRAAGWDVSTLARVFRDTAVNGFAAVPGE